MGGNDLLTYTSSLNEILSWMIHWFDGEEEAHRTGIKQKAVSGSTGSDNTRQIFVLLCLLRGFQTVYYFMERKVALHGAVVKANSALGLFFNHKGRFLFCRYLVVNQSFGGIPHFDLRKRWKVWGFVADCRCQIPRPSIGAISIRTRPLGARKTSEIPFVIQSFIFRATWTCEQMSEKSFPYVGKVTDGLNENNWAVGWNPWPLAADDMNMLSCEVLFLASSWSARGSSIGCVPTKKTHS